jgi:hypothetical protein
VKKLAKLKQWLTVDDAARLLSISLQEEVERKDVLQLGLDGRLTLSVYFVNHAHGKFAKDVPSSEARVMVGERWQSSEGSPRPGPIQTFENWAAVPREVLEGIANRTLNFCSVGDAYHAPDGTTRVIETEEVGFVRTLTGVWDLTMVGAEHLDVEHEIQQLTGGPDVTLSSLGGVVLRNGDQFAVLYESFPEEFIRKNQEKKGVEKPYDDSSNWFPAGGLAAADTVLVVRTERVTALIDSLADGDGGGQHDRLSDARLKVIAALVEHSAGIDLHRPRGQAAELKRLIDKTGYGPVSADVCESVINAIKDRMPDWD